MSTDRPCPNCTDLLTHHYARLPRTLCCRDCPCCFTVRWRYTWALALLWASDRLNHWGHR